MEPDLAWLFFFNALNDLKLNKPCLFHILDQKGWLRYIALFFKKNRVKSKGLLMQGKRKEWPVPFSSEVFLTLETKIEVMETLMHAIARAQIHFWTEKVMPLLTDRNGGSDQVLSIGIL